MTVLKATQHVINATATENVEPRRDFNAEMEASVFLLATVHTPLLRCRRGATNV